MTGCSSPLQGSAPTSPDSLNQLAATLAGIKRVIVVLSGKGGVGKSTLAANLAIGLSLADKTVGLLDADVHGPSIARMLSLDALAHEGPRMQGGELVPAAWSRNLRVMTLGLFLDKLDAVIWRGPMKQRMIQDFVARTAWGPLDYLVVDCPPGAGDEPLTVLQLFGPSAEALIVTTPQTIAIDDVRRSVRFCRELGVDILGVVENMASFACPGCGQVHDLFGEGGGKKLALELGVPFLASVPIDPELRRSGDEGYAILKTRPESPAATALTELIGKIRMFEKP